MIFRYMNMAKDNKCIYKESGTIIYILYPIYLCINKNTFKADY